MFIYMMNMFDRRYAMMAMSGADVCGGYRDDKRVI